MARFGIVFGLLLCGLTFVGLVGTSDKIPAQFFPMMLGIPILFCGVVALNPHRRKAAIEVALLISGAGAIGGLVRVAYCLIGFAGPEFSRYAFNLIVLMTAICTVFTAICLVSFRSLRRKALLRSEAGSSIKLASSKSSTVPNQDVQSRESA